MAALPRWLSFILLPPHPSPFHSLLLLTIPVPAAVALQAELLSTLLEWTAFPFSSKDFLLVLHRLILITKPDPLAWFCQGRHSTQVDGSSQDLPWMPQHWFVLSVQSELHPQVSHSLPILSLCGCFCLGPEHGKRCWTGQGSEPVARFPREPLDWCSQFVNNSGLHLHH